jgi:hypothetical protein
MANTPLTINIPIRGTLLLRIDGSDKLHELGRVEYSADVNVVLEEGGSVHTPVYASSGFEHGCHASRDGDCYWVGCPQTRDGEPKATGRHCPLDNGEDGW